MNFNFMDDLFQEPIQHPHDNFKHTNSNNPNNMSNSNNLDEFYNTNSFETTKQLYQNTKGINTPKSYMVVLDSRAISSDTVANNFVYNKVVFDLCDPIIIDSPTDIYLEFLHFQNIDISDSSGTEIIPHLEQTSQFYIDIDEFSIKNISNNQFQSGKFLIPNDIYGKTDQNQNDNDTNVRTSFIRLKSNYLCRIEASYINKLTVTIRAEGVNGADGSDETTFSYLSNRDKEVANYSTSGAIKIGLYFHKK
jgi:hypothetical protein